MGVLNWCFVCFFVLVSTVTAQSSNSSTTLASTTFTNTRRFLFDTDGNQIDAYGSKVNFFNNTYYLYGNSFSVRGVAFGIKSYSSNDLMNWKYEGYLYDPFVPNPCNNIGGCGRPHILQHPTTSQYILWANAGSSGYVVATSSSPTGPFGFVGLAAIDPAFSALQPADFAVESFGDQAYIVFSALNFRYPAAGSLWPPIQQTLHISELTSDFLNTTLVSYNVSSSALDLIDQEAESPDLFMRNGLFYVVASNTCGYCNGSIALVYRADSITGPWTRQIIAADGCNSQVEGVLPLPQQESGSNETTYLWHGTSVPGGPRTGFSGHIFQPLQFNSDNSVQDLNCDPSAEFPVSFVSGTQPTSTPTTVSISPPTAVYTPVCDSSQFTLIQLWTSVTSGTLRSVSVNIAAVPGVQTIPLTLLVFTIGNSTDIASLEAPGFRWTPLGNATYNSTQLSYVFDNATVFLNEEPVVVSEGDVLGVTVSGLDFSPYCHLEYDLTSNNDDETGMEVGGKDLVLLQQGAGQNSWRGLDGMTSVVYPRVGKGLKLSAIMN